MYRILLLVVLGIVSGCSRPEAPATGTDNPAPAPAPQAESNPPAGETPSGASAGATADDWKPYTLEEAGVTAEFPSEPKHYVDTAEDGAVTHSYEVQLGRVYLTVMFDQLGDEASAGPEAILAGIAENTAEMTTAKQSIQLDDHPGLDLTMEVEQDGTPVVLRNQVYVVGTRLYQVMVSRPKSKPEAALTARFLSGFKLLD